MTVLVLLTAVLVGSMVTASAEEVTYEAAVFADETATEPLFTGTLVDALANVGDDGKSVIKLYNDVELTTKIALSGFAKLDGQDNTIYIDETLLVAANNSFISAGNVTVANTNFIGQDKSWNGLVGDMLAFGQNTSGATRICGAILVGQTNKFVMENCTMQYFKTNGRGSCIAFNSLHGQPNDLYYEDFGVWLKDTTITNNYSVGASAGLNANAVYMMQSQTTTRFGPKVHVSGNTVIENNYDQNGAATANVYVAQSSGNTSSVLIVEEDFTGKVGVTTTTIGPSESQPRGCVFFKGASYDAEGNYNRAGEIFASSTQWAAAKDEALVKFNETSAYEGNWGYAVDTKPVVTNTVELVIMDAAGTTEIMTLTQTLADGAALPTWADFGVTTHTAGILTYTGKVAYDTGFMVSDDNGATWSYNADISSSISNSWEYVEALGDFELNATPSTGYNSNMVIDFNGYTVTRASQSYYLKWEGTGSGSATQNITIKNGVFDGTIDGVVPTDGVTFIRGYQHATMTLENCSFSNFIVTDTASETKSSYAAVIMANATSSITLKDVTATNCKGHQGVIYAGAIPVYIAGNTRIGEIENGAIVSGTAMGLYAIGTSLAVTETFTGEVYCSLEGYKIANQPVYFKSSSVTATDEMKAKAFVAEGALILGRIAPSGDPTGYFAYNNGGTLSWTKPGNALDAKNVTAVTYDADTNKLSGKVWHYNDGTKYVPTTTAVAGYYDYSLKDVEADAVINADTLVYGDLATVIGKATAGQTVEVLKDVDGIRNISISKAITLDGNGHTLTWYIAEDPAAEADSTAFMFKAATGGIVYKDILFHGGAAEKGVWAGGLAQNNATMLPHGDAVTFNNCTITGVRVEWDASADTGYLFGAQSSLLTLIDTTVTDNIVKIGTGAYNAGPHLMRQNANNVVSLNGKIVIAGNYRLAGDGKAYQGNLQINSSASANQRVLLGQLTEGSELHTFWAGSYAPVLNAEGKPYNNSGYLYVDSGSSQATMKTNDDGSIAISGGSNYQSNLVYTGTLITQAADSEVGFGETVTTQGAITTDKFELNYKPTVVADYYGTDVVVKIGNKEVARNNLSTYTPEESVITVEAIVGMAELTDVITLELQDATTKEALASWTTTAKTYANGLIDAATGVTVEQKMAAASLLQYGAMVQTYFGYNVNNLAMTVEEKATWTAAGYITDLAECDINTSASKVKSSVSGSVSGLTFGGVALTMENQMSLRLYLVASDMDALTATVNGAAVEIERDAQGYYVEASNIGTAKLAEAVTFVITDGNTSVTVTASPMTYVYNVLTITHDSITEDLRNACEALYYYYAAAAACFDFTDATGFAAAVGTMVKALDTPNAFGAPYGI